MKSFGEFFNKLNESDKLLNNFRNAILYNTVVKIIDPRSRTVLWNCNTDMWFDTRFKELEVEQEINMKAILEDIEKVMKGEDI